MPRISEAVRMASERDRKVRNAVPDTLRELVGLALSSERMAEATHVDLDRVMVFLHKDHGLRPEFLTKKYVRRMLKAYGYRIDRNDVVYLHIPMIGGYWHG